MPTGGITVCGQEFRAIREENVMGKAETARAIGLSIGGYERIERKLSVNVMPSTIRRFAKFFELDLGAFFDRIRVRDGDRDELQKRLTA